jgi:hypothetical protein
MELESEVIKPGKPHSRICLGVLGKREDISQEAMRDKVLHPILAVLGKVPDIVYMPSDGTSSAVIGAWTDRCEINNEMIHADFRKLGRRAFAMRDARILKDASDILVFEQPKSEYLVKLGIREMKKGKRIFSVSPGKNWELQQWEDDTSCTID